MSRTLNGKNCIITGGGRGIGFAIVEKFASLGANIVINYTRTLPEQKLLDDLCENYKVKILCFQADVSDYDKSKELIDFAKDSLGSIDILVNNAGITRDSLLMRMKEKDFDDVININLKGTYNCLAHASNVMLKQKYGKIINISSVVALTGNAGQVNYCASKAGVIGITKAAARELGSRNITVNAIAPGFIESDMTAELPQKIKDEILSRMIIKRFGKTEDIACAAAFLASSEADFITGQVLVVDGGMYI